MLLLLKKRLNLKETVFKICNNPLWSKMRLLACAFVAYLIQFNSMQATFIWQYFPKKVASCGLLSAVESKSFCKFLFIRFIFRFLMPVTVFVLAFSTFRGSVLSVAAAVAATASAETTWIGIDRAKQMLVFALCLSYHVSCCSFSFFFFCFVCLLLPAAALSASILFKQKFR